MSMTMTEKILAAHSGRNHVKPGEIIKARLDLVVCHDATTPPTLVLLEKYGVKHVFDPSKVVVTPDHFVPNKDIQTAQNLSWIRRWVKQTGIQHFYDIGRHGICHALVPEEGFVRPGMVVVAGDSHAPTMGAFGTFATGVGSTDLAVALATGEIWFKVPHSLLFHLRGPLPPGVYAKDIILYIISKIGVAGATYQAMEYTGDTLATLSMEARMTICNMAIEAGGKSALMPADDVTRDYLHERMQEPYEVVRSDPGAEYAGIYDIDVSQLEPIVATPYLPSNGKFIGEVAGTPLDQVYIGSCTNARIEDLRVAAQILKGNKVAPGMRLLIVPATTRIWNQALQEGLIEIFAAAGAVVSSATCGACFGGHIGVVDKDERCLSTTNRNFRGRMGHPEAQVYLASPATAAASALTGVITDPRDVLPSKT